MMRRISYRSLNDSGPARARESHASPEGTVTSGGRAALA
jgi:hypothetical protein